MAATTALYIFAPLAVCGKTRQHMAYEEYI